MRFTASMGVLALLLSLLVPAGAQTDLTEDPAEEAEKVDYDAISMDLDQELNLLVFSLGMEGEELPDCTAAEILTDGEEPTTETEGCHVVSIAGPNGQVNHGSVVSAMAHYLGPGKGKIMRHVAKSNFGKGDQMVKVDGADGGEEADAGEEADTEETKPEGWIPPGQAKKQGQ